MKNIWILEDDTNIRELVSYSLEQSGYSTFKFSSPSSFWTALEENFPDLLILDLMLPEEDGLSILEKLREENKTKDLPIIILTAKSSEIDTIKGLDPGADDYIKKPFSVLELISRVKARLRRLSDSEEEIQINTIRILPERHEVYQDGQLINLTKKEYDLLILLAKNKGLVLTRDQLLNQIWGYDFNGENRTVDVHIRSLRKKLNSTCIQTVRGLGYKISNNE